MILYVVYRPRVLFLIWLLTDSNSYLTTDLLNHVVFQRRGLNEDKMSSEKQNKDITLQTQEEGAKTFQLDKTQLDEIPEEKKSERSQNCATWSQNLLKSKKFSKMTQEYRDNKEFKPNVSTTVSENRMDKNR